MNKSTVTVALLLILTLVGCGGSDTSDQAPFSSNPYLAGLIDECATGNMAACNELYMESPLGSPFEIYGATCGARTSFQDATPGACR